MKAIIDGLRYNTETAEEIADWGNGLGRSDFGFCYETLYKTKKGAWFLFGEGGANSRYSEPVGNMSGAGWEIIPLPEDKAVKWLETTSNYNIIEKYFPEVIRDA